MFGHAVSERVDSGRRGPRVHNDANSRGGKGDTRSRSRILDEQAAVLAYTSAPILGLYGCSGVRGWALSRRAMARRLLRIDRRAWLKRWTRLPAARRRSNIRYTKESLMKDEEIRELLYQASRPNGRGQVTRSPFAACEQRRQEGVGGVPRADAESRAHRARRCHAPRSRHGGGDAGSAGGPAHRRVAGEGDGNGPRAGKPEAAQLVAAECVVLAETKDHLNWELIGELAKKAKGEMG